MHYKEIELLKGVCNLAHRPSIISLNGELEVEKYKNSVRYMTHRTDYKTLIK